MSIQMEKMRLVFRFRVGSEYGESLIGIVQRAAYLILINHKNQFHQGEDKSHYILLILF